MEDSILQTEQHVLIIGGGIFGLTAAIVLAEAGMKVAVAEKEADIMLGASLVNQNRIHFGYHYPRSKETCLESLEGLLSFKRFYQEAIYSGFKKYYAIAKEGSHLNAEQFYLFCKDLNLQLEEAYPSSEIMNRDMVENCWLTDEPIFDFNILKQLVTYRIASNKNILLLRNVRPISMKNRGDKKDIKLSDGSTITCHTIVNATYASISETAEMLGLDPIPAKYEYCLMPILQSTKTLQPFGVTIMDGPFCSLMPRGLSREEFLLYHVKYSVLETHIGAKNIPWSPIAGFPELEIMEKSRSYFPVLDSMRIYDAWITTRIVLPTQESDDARPTLTIEHGDHIYSLFSGKLTTCVSAANDLLKKMRQDEIG
jgi:glycine/D-amino acid oxidase-like deaminating enzyme